MHRFHVLIRCVHTHTQKKSPARPPVSRRWSKQREKWLQPTGSNGKRPGGLSWTGLSLMDFDEADFSLNAGRYPKPIPLTELVDHLFDRWA